MQSMSKATKLAMGYRVKNKVAIYGGAHWTEGMTLWRLFCQFMEQYPDNRAWLEFGRYSYEYWQDGVLTGVEQAFVTGLGISDANLK